LNEEARFVVDLLVDAWPLAAANMLMVATVVPACRDRVITLIERAWAAMHT
jgi:hypothetical protein